MLNPRRAERFATNPGTVRPLRETGTDLSRRSRNETPAVVMWSASVVEVNAPWSDLQVRPMTADEAGLIATWRYRGEWSVYDLGSPQPMLDDLASYYSGLAGRTLIGFCCIGEAVRVPGMTKEPATLDVGMGMDPAQVGRGNRTVFGRAVLNYLSTAHPGQALRAVVQRWNERSLRLTRRYDDDFDAEFPHHARPAARCRGPRSRRHRGSLRDVVAP